MSFKCFFIQNYYSKKCLYILIFKLLSILHNILQTLPPQLFSTKLDKLNRLTQMSPKYPSLDEYTLFKLDYLNLFTIQNAWKWRCFGKKSVHGTWHRNYVLTHSQEWILVSNSTMRHDSTSLELQLITMCMRIKCKKRKICHVCRIISK